MFEGNFMKRLLALIAAGFVLPTGIAGANLINEGRNIAALNANNLVQTNYTLPTARNNVTEYSFELKGYVLGLRIIRANYMGWHDTRQYALYADIKTSGLGALLKKLEIWAVSAGDYTRSGLRPRFHVQQNLNKNNRRVEMNYDNTALRVETQILPPLGSQGTPAASRYERYNADDTLSSVLNFMMRGQSIDGEVCYGGIRVFDSKQHYNLRMENQGIDRVKFEGDKVDVIECYVYYEPISGFDPEDLPDSEESTTPIKVYLKAFPELGLYVPVRMTYKISALKAVIKIDEMTIKTPQL